MTVDPAINTYEWQRVLDSAEAGDLALDPAVAGALEKVCDDYLVRLEEQFFALDQLRRINGFGTLPSATILEKKFSLKASGADRSLEAVLLQHIDAVKLAKQAVAKAVQNFAEQDLASGEYISGTTP